MKTDDSRPKRVLIIDSDELNRRAIRHRLEREDVTVLLAGDDEEGIALAGEARPELILVDLSDEEAAQVEMIARLKADVVTWNIPIVALADVDSPVRRDRVGLGVCRFLRKPIYPRALAQAILYELGVLSPGE